MRGQGQRTYGRERGGEGHDGQERDAESERELYLPLGPCAGSSSNDDGRLLGGWLTRSFGVCSITLALEED